MSSSEQTWGAVAADTAMLSAPLDGDASQLVGATAEDIAAINARLRDYEAPKATAAPAPAPAGVVTMDVEEVGRPTS